MNQKLEPQIHHQLHGYRSGHQLLDSTIRLERADQDLIDRLSDMAGPLRPGESFDPYLSCYPLPSGKYYAISRTKQDIQAPRAGCVITRTILVPMHYWESHEHVPALIEIISEDTGIYGPFMRGGGHLNVEPQTVKSGVLPELLEAIFLEKREPIVVFSAVDVEPITVRLLSALWPAMRRSFSVCTHSLAPRTLVGKPFDLLFAPKHARSRFSEWAGRRIDGAGKESNARHRWTDALVQRVFENALPCLISPNIAPLLAGTPGDESALRLTLMWEELESKSKDSPSAILGMMDIANSKQLLKNMWPRLEPGILNALDISVKSQSQGSTWKFIRDLAAKLGKLPESDLSPIIIKTIEVARSDVSAALDGISAINSSSPLYSKQLIQAIAESIDTASIQKSVAVLSKIDPSQLLQLTLFNPELISLVNSEASRSTNIIFINSLSVAVANSSRQDRAAYAIKFSPNITRDIQSLLLRELLGGAEVESIVKTSEIILSKSQAPELIKEICESAIANHAQQHIREIFAKNLKSSAAAQYILELIDYNFQDAMWLLTSKAIAEIRPQLLDSFISNGDDKQLAQSFTTPEMSGQVIDTLLSNPKVHALAALRFIKVSISDADTFINVAKKIYIFLPSSEQYKASLNATSMTFNSPGVSLDYVRKLIVAFPEHVDINSLLIQVRQHNKKDLLLDVVLSAFDLAHRNLLRLSDENTRFLTGWLSSKAKFTLSANSASVLAKILDNVREDNYSAYEQASLNLLPALMKSTRSPVSAVIVVTFPAVYELLKRKENSFKLSKLFFFTDWDKCKTARIELVRAFLGSNWPPSDLASAAHRTHDSRRILNTVLREPGGRAYLNRIKKSSKELDENCQREIMRELELLEFAGPES